MVIGCLNSKFDGRRESTFCSNDDNDAKRKYAEGAVHRAHSRGSYRMRSDSVDIGDVGKLPEQKGLSANTPGCSDLGAAIWKHDASMVDKCTRAKHLT